MEEMTGKGVGNSFISSDWPTDLWTLEVSMKVKCLSFDYEQGFTYRSKPYLPNRTACSVFVCYAVHLPLFFSGWLRELLSSMSSELWTLPPPCLHVISVGEPLGYQDTLFESSGPCLWSQERNYILSQMCKTNYDSESPCLVSTQRYVTSIVFSRH